MKMSSLTCPHCHAVYEVAEALSVAGPPGRVDCSICGTPLAAWDEPRLRAFRLVIAPERKYPRVPAPAALA